MNVKKWGILIIIVGMFGWAVYDLTKGEESTAPKESEKQQSEESFDVQSEETSSEDVGLSVGQKAPDFEVTTLEGKKTSLSEYQGEKVMLNFWATWCPPCRAEMPDMEKFYQNKDVTILAVNLTQTEAKIDKVKNFKKEFGLSFPILLDKENNIANKYQIRPIPTTYMIDTKGTIQHKSLGAMNYERMVQQFQDMN